MADEITAQGKYLYIEVPEFAIDALGPEEKRGPMSSFIRLGAFHDSMDKVPGKSWELAQHAQKASIAQGGHINAEYGEEIVGFKQERGVPFFLDDERNREGSPGTPDADKLQQSQKLFERGGWWDHSDGNRISTTWGDKIEVIRGNYKMVVMGRQDDPEYAAGWDVSGGHVQDTGHSMPGASVRVEYRQDKHTGAWHLENTTNGFIQTSDYAGDFFEHWFGDKKYSTIGSENPVDHDGNKPKGNPHLLDKTWARKIESYTGSEGWRIPEIIEETWASTTTSKTDVSGDITEETYCGGTLSSLTGSSSARVPNIREKTYARDTTSTTDVSGTIKEDTTCGVQAGFTMAGAITDVTLAGAQEEVAILGHHGSVEIALLLTELFLGNKLSITLGPSASITIPEEKEIKLKDIKTALEKVETSLKKQFLSIDFQALATTARIMGMGVYLGP